MFQKQKELGPGGSVLGIGFSILVILVRSRTG
jgi:hypothetical protein